jgi:hypothetical protein
VRPRLLAGRCGRRSRVCHVAAPWLGGLPQLCYPRASPANLHAVPSRDLANSRCGCPEMSAPKCKIAGGAGPFRRGRR